MAAPYRGFRSFGDNSDGNLLVSVDMRDAADIATKGGTISTPTPATGPTIDPARGLVGPTTDDNGGYKFNLASYISAAQSAALTERGGCVSIWISKDLFNFDGNYDTAADHDRVFFEVNMTAATAATRIPQLLAIGNTEGVWTVSPRFSETSPGGEAGYKAISAYTEYPQVQDLYNYGDLPDVVRCDLSFTDDSVQWWVNGQMLWIGPGFAKTNADSGVPDWQLVNVGAQNGQTGSGALGSGIQYPNYIQKWQISSVPLHLPKMRPGNAVCIGGFADIRRGAGACDVNNSNLGRLARYSHAQIVTGSSGSGDMVSDGVAVGMSKIFGDYGLWGDHAVAALGNGGLSSQLDDVANAIIAFGIPFKIVVLHGGPNDLSSAGTARSVATIKGYYDAQLTPLFAAGVQNVIIPYSQTARHWSSWTASFDTGVDNHNTAVDQIVAADTRVTTVDLFNWLGGHSASSIYFNASSYTLSKKGQQKFQRILYPAIQRLIFSS